MGMLTPIMQLRVNKFHAEEASPSSASLRGNKSIGLQSSGSKGFKSYKSLNIQSNKQTFDAKQERLIAEGQVRAWLDGGLLLADHISWDSKYQTLYARGKVRFKKGGQYFQASSLRYSFIEEEGELNDVYGILDFQKAKADFFNLGFWPAGNASTFLNGDEVNKELTSLDNVERESLIASLDKGMACPPIKKVRLSRKRLPSIDFPPPIGCPGTYIRSNRNQKSVSEILGEITMGDGFLLEKELNKDGFNSFSKSSSDSLEDSTIKTFRPDSIMESSEVESDKLVKLFDQRIDQITLRDRLTFETRFGVPRSLRNVDEKNKYGSIRVSQLIRQGRKKFIMGSISRWRFQSPRIKLFSDGWMADRMSFTNDPFSPAQSRTDAVKVVAKEQENGDLLVNSYKNELVLEERLRIPLIRSRRIRKKEEVENRWLLGIDDKDRDGLFVGRNIKEINLIENYKLYLQPQFLIQRAYNGSTNSYVSPGSSTYSQKVFQSARNSDLFGLEAELKGVSDGWDVGFNADISTFNMENFVEGSRFWGSLVKPFNVKTIGQLDVRFFGAFRYRAWNGSLGETSIYNAFGAFLEKKQNFLLGKGNGNYLLRLGGGNYQAESFEGNDLIGMWRGNIHSSINLSYPIWKSKRTANLGPNSAYRYSPIPIRPGLNLDTNLRSTLSKYGNGDNQNVLSISTGPTLTLGTFSRNYLDYTKLAVSLGRKFKNGISPFKYDRAVDLRTLGIGLTQQIIGPLVLGTGIEINIDPSDDNYGDLINSNAELIWQRRSYDFALYYNPYKGIGGLRFRLNDFNITGTGTPFYPYETVLENDNF